VRENIRARRADVGGCRAMILESLTVEPLFVPLVEPFVIATARMDTTRAGLVRVVVRDGARTEGGLGEAACLPPVTREDWPDVERAVAASQDLVGREHASVRALMEGVLPNDPVTRAGIETALLDAHARIRGVPFMPGDREQLFFTDITLPIVETEHMVRLAREWRARGFDHFKVKVGKDVDQDARSLVAVHHAVPRSTFRIDANGGYTAPEAIALLRVLRDHELEIECFEQPCAREDLDAMARVHAEGIAPVIADESVRSLAELELVAKHKAARGVNLKLVKMGGPIAAREIGTRARQLDMLVMCGAMVETRLGLCAMANTVVPLGGADFVDLDTQFLLTEDRFEGGWTVNRDQIRLTSGPGLDVRVVRR
jgi:L-alanine-DL-glutamate epimerase-like enolase superfamily enzyme